MNKLTDIVENNQQIAWKVIKDTGIISLWQTIGGEVHLVGSVNTGLLIKNMDIDLHIYTDRLHVAESFAVIGKLAENPSIKEIQYINQADTEEECLEWHIQYESEEYGKWKMDMIHILKGSKYDGVVEKVTGRIKEVLTPETRGAILQIKLDLPSEAKVPGVDIYRAVLSHGIRTSEEFNDWYKDNKIANTLDWMP